jgi:predicted amidohydrolase YtcJ
MRIFMARSLTQAPVSLRAVPGPAELIVCGARTLGAAGADSVVVRGGRIAAVTTRRLAMASRAAATRVIEAPGGLVCPGFHDAHAHLVTLGMARREVDLHGLTIDGIVAAVRGVAAQRAPNRWIIGRGFDPEVFRLGDATARAALDAIETAPVLLRSHDYHSAALNTLGLIRAGFLPRVPEIDGGSADRDESGAPTGILREMAAFVASSQAEDLTAPELAEAVAAALPEFHRAGVTAVHDMSGSRAHPALRALDAAGRLALDVYATVSPGEAAVPELRTPGRAIAVVGMKAFLDGALGSRTAHLLEPYEGDACHRGVAVLPPETVRDMVRATAAAGLPSFLHAIGDAAVRSALDALEGVRGPDGAALRHRVEHAQMVHDDDLPRFARAGIVASVQPVHMALDAPLVHRHWGARAREAFPLRRLLDSGAPLAFGSDAPIETCDVLDGIRCATERRGRDGTPLSPEESITPAEALAAYTSGAAWAVGRESSSGALRVGDAANVTLLTQDVAARPESLADAAVAATIVRGELVFDGGRS